MQNITYGSRGSSVLLLQLALKRAGYYAAEPDGVFGTRTLNAVRRFQSGAGLVPDGMAGPGTLSEAEPFLLGFRLHRLRAGDTFYRLAKRFGTAADAIASANPSLDPSELPIGAEIVIPLGFRVTPTDVPYSSELCELVVRGLAARYPFIRDETIGNSALGRPLHVLKMGRGKRQVFVNAAHHGNEWITTPLVLDFVESWAGAYASHGTIEGRSAAALYDSVTLYAAPMVDPDGVDIVNGAVSKEGYARALAIAEDFPDIPFPSGWKANAEGTDLNLNYPAEWEKARETKFALGFTRPAPRDFVGTAPLSAPEARAVYDFTLAHDLALTLSYHTQGGEIYWRFGDIEPEGARRIAERMADVSGYAVSDVPPASSYAGYRDWFIAEYRRPGFTVEAGRGKNPLPLTQYAELRADNFALIAAAMEG